MKEIVSPKHQKEFEHKVLTFLHSHGGKIRVGDVAALLVLPINESSRVLEGLLSTYKCSFSVTADGDLVYDFGQVMRPRRNVTFFSVLKEFGVSIVKGIFNGFKSLLSLYFKLLIGPIWNIAIGVIFRKRKSDKSFSMKLIDFVFGRKRNQQESLREQQRVFLQFLQENAGICTTEDVVKLFGVNKAAAEDFLATQIAYFHGKPTVAEGAYFYADFVEIDDLYAKQIRQNNYKNNDELIRQPYNFFYNKSTIYEQVSGNENKHDDNYVIAMNSVIFMSSGFHLVSTIALGSFYTPFMSENALFFYIMIIFYYVPGLFSILTFLIPILRIPMVRKKNKVIAIEAIKKRVYQLIFSNPAIPFIRQTAFDSIRNMRLTKYERRLSLTEIENALSECIESLNGRLLQQENGNIGYDFSELFKKIEIVEDIRIDKLLRSNKTITFDSEDDPSDQ